MVSISSSPYCSSTLILESIDTNFNGQKSSSSSKRYCSIISCNISSSKNHEYKIPKLEPFSRSKFDRAVKDPPLIQKSEDQLADYCSVLEGDDSYNCWQAYFELKDLEKEYPKEEVERLIIEAGGVKSLIGCLHGVSAIHKANKEAINGRSKEEETKHKNGVQRKNPIHIPDGLPKTAEELEEEEKARMPDSPFTRMLRLRGKHPAWYSPAPDHETD
ncbi:CCG-binding protein 1 [Amaranthus tricolor]|uniref:CCG-binding protein 1 n=1 Tax=Amaranthus tricolor TaxID=29722 RepID=UPI002583B98E|nr:CCG-binding protein 1 [Amaranthus tricolor]